MKARSNLAATRLAPQELAEIDRLALWEGLDRSALLKRLIRDGLERTRWRIAVERFRDGRWSLRLAAEAAGLSYRQMLERLAAEGVPIGYTERDFEEDLRGIDGS